MHTPPAGCKPAASTAGGARTGVDAQNPWPSGCRSCILADVPGLSVAGQVTALFQAASVGGIDSGCRWNQTQIPDPLHQVLVVELKHDTHRVSLPTQHVGC